MAAMERSTPACRQVGQADRGVARIGDRNRERRHEPEHNTEEREQNRNDDYLHIGAGDGEGCGAPGDGEGCGPRILYAAAGWDGFITLT